MDDTDSHGVTLRISAIGFRAGNMILSIIWVMMGLRFMGASPSQEGKWLPYQFALGHCSPYLRLIAVSFISALRVMIGSCRAVAALVAIPDHRDTVEHSNMFMMASSLPSSPPFSASHHIGCIPSARVPAIWLVAARAAETCG